MMRSGAALPSVTAVTFIAANKNQAPRRKPGARGGLAVLVIVSKCIKMFSPPRRVHSASETADQGFLPVFSWFSLSIKDH